jgi:hypothetical protein
MLGRGLPSSRHFVGEVMLLPKKLDWSTALRTAVALVPLTAMLFWVRSLDRWMQKMDELHRRITIAASVFATVATLFGIAALHLLAVAGVLPGRIKPTTGFVMIWLVICFYLVGRRIFNRRYQ